MIGAGKLWCVAVISSLLFVFGTAVGFRGNEPIVPAVAEENKSSDLKFVQVPVTEKKVNDFVDSVRSQLKQVKTPNDLEKRDDYVKELVGVLQRFVPNDALRQSKSPPDDRRLWLSDRTAARIVRLLGDLHAVEAVETICDYLYLPIDVDVFKLTAGEPYPTIWALFEIGDASLPALRKRMTGTGDIRGGAYAAALILGPRADEELANWIAAAETEPERERLNAARPTFQSAAGWTKQRNLTPEEYRKMRLEGGRQFLRSVLDQPSDAEIIAEQIKKEMRKRELSEEP